MKTLTLTTNEIAVFRLRVFDNGVAVSDLRQNTTSFLTLEEGRNLVKAFTLFYENPKVC